MKPIANDWEIFERMLLADAGPVQRRDMRRAFYAGASALFNAILEGLDPDPGHEPTHADLHRMDSISAELDEWWRELAAGRA